MLRKFNRAVLLVLATTTSTIILASAGPGAVAERFVGTWRLMSIEDRLSDGTVVPATDFGTAPIGYLIYDTTGHMAAQIMRSDRPHFASATEEGGTPDEMKAAFLGYAAYFGTYTVHEKEGFVVHRVEGGLFPNYVGQDLKRFFTLSDGRLVLQPPPFQIGGKEVTRRLTWRRV